MRVFISWSGEQSRAIAERLREWLPCVIQDLEPWMSTEDVRKGARWHAEIAVALETAKAGILCITAENIDAPWLVFEAGALSKSIPSSSNSVCTYLYGSEPSDLGRGPLSQFQHTKAEKADTFRLLKALNTARGDKALDESLLLRLFEKWWPDLEIALAKLPKSSVTVRPRRSDRELLEDIWNIISEQARYQDHDMNDDDTVELPRLDILEALRKSLQEQEKPAPRSPSKKRK